MKIGDTFTVELTEDLVTGELILPIPEAIINANEWFEGTLLEISVDGSEIIITEAD
jgi:hypothetical protein